MTILLAFQTGQAVLQSCSPIPGIDPVIFHIWGPISLRW
ncbi:hypothetical protein MNBD_ALPHA06-1036, partial [hydrothermal vent metagenome]